MRRNLRLRRRKILKSKCSDCGAPSIIEIDDGALCHDCAFTRLRILLKQPPKKAPQWPIIIELGKRLGCGLLLAVFAAFLLGYCVHSAHLDCERYYHERGEPIPEGECGR
jgi:DNA-directed RNA polymerase subunit RPC12/RpoP